MLLPSGYLAAHVWKRFIRRLPPSEYVSLAVELPHAPDSLWTDTERAFLYRWARTPLLELDYVSGSRDGDPEVEEEKPRSVLAKVSRHARPGFSSGAVLFSLPPRASTTDTESCPITDIQLSLLDRPACWRQGKTSYRAVSWLRSHLDRICRPWTFHRSRLYHHRIAYSS